MTTKKDDDATPAPVKQPKPPAADECTVAGTDGVQFNVKRPPVPPGRKDGDEFNHTVTHQETRRSHSQRFRVQGGKSVPVS